jgi:hypothetical protein
MVPGGAFPNLGPVAEARPAGELTSTAGQLFLLIASLPPDFLLT